MRRLLVAASTASVMAACAPSDSTSAPATSSPSPRATLVAVVQGGTPFDVRPDTVAIIDLAGTVVATARFQPGKRPYIGNAGVPLQPVAAVGRAGVYYIDGFGTVSLLAPHSMSQVVARFPQQPEQFETWFAVSPDGGRVLAGVLAFPAVVPPPADSPFPTLVGPWKFDLQSSSAGGPATTLVHFESASGGAVSWKPTFPIGWTADGPVAMVPASIGTQNAWWGGPLYQIDDAGARTTRVGGSDCDSASITQTGFIPCTVGGSPLTVRDTRGDILWTAVEAQGFNAIGQYLAPDGQAISDGDVVETRTDGAVPMPPGFRVQGWMSSTVVVGRLANLTSTTGEMGDLAWVSLSDPSTPHDLGIKADFVGTLAP